MRSIRLWRVAPLRPRALHPLRAQPDTPPTPLLAILLDPPHQVVARTIRRAQLAVTVHAALRDAVARAQTVDLVLQRLERRFRRLVLVEVADQADADVLQVV